MTPEVEAAIRELRIITECVCDEAWTSRRKHETDCVSEWRGEVETLVAYIRALEQDVMSDETRASVKRGLADAKAGRVTTYGNEELPKGTCHVMCDREVSGRHARGCNP